MTGAKMTGADIIRIALDNLTIAVQENSYGDINGEVIQSFGELYSAIGVYAMEMELLKKENDILRKLLVEKFS